MKKNASHYNARLKHGLWVIPYKVIKKKTAKCNLPTQIFIKHGKIKNLLLLFTENLKIFQNRTRIDWVMTFQKLKFCNHLSRTKLSFLGPYVSITHHLLRRCIIEKMLMHMDRPTLNLPKYIVITHARSSMGLQFVISWIWSWKITHAWPNFDPL